MQFTVVGFDHPPHFGFLRVDRAASSRSRSSAELELICVDDGSPDKSREILADLQSQHSDLVCDREGLPLVHPSQFPRNGLLAARVAIVGLEDGWTPAFSRAVYQANFVDDQDISKAEVLAPLIASVGAGPDQVLAAAATDPIKARLKDHVCQAQERGLFGAPSFVTADGELFWGNDRLEQALDWAVRHQDLETA